MMTTEMKYLLTKKFWSVSFLWTTLHTQKKNAFISNRNNNHNNPEFIKFVYLLVDPYLRWDHHIDFICTKLRKIVFFLSYLVNIDTLVVLVTAFNSLFQLHMPYCLLTWVVLQIGFLQNFLFWLEHRVELITWNLSNSLKC